MECQIKEPRGVECKVTFRGGGVECPVTESGEEEWSVR